MLTRLNSNLKLYLYLSYLRVPNGMQRRVISFGVRTYDHMITCLTSLGFNGSHASGSEYS